MDANTNNGLPCEVSVILPALDEERTIGECITKIKEVFAENTITGEIIVADASTDRTAEIARSMGAVVIHPVKNGYGNAYLEAFRHAHGRFIILGDADNTYDFSEIPRLLAPLEAGADFVIGSRFKGTIHPGSMSPLHRYIGNPVLTWMMNVIFHTHFSDTHSGFRAITREALTGQPEDRRHGVRLRDAGDGLKGTAEDRRSTDRLLSKDHALKIAQFCRWLAARPVCPPDETPAVHRDPGPGLLRARPLPHGLFLCPGRHRNLPSPYVHSRCDHADGWAAGHPHRVPDEDLLGGPWVR